MNNFFLDAVLGVVLPGIMAVIMQSNWPTKFKTNVSWVICFIVAAGVTAYQHGQHINFSPEGLKQLAFWLVAHFGAIQTFTKAVHDGAYKPTGLADAIEKATTIEKGPSEADIKLRAMEAEIARLRQGGARVDTVPVGNPPVSSTPFDNWAADFKMPEPSPDDAQPFPPPQAIEVSDEPTR